jgi:SAM-dependent methyltransferase
VTDPALELPIPPRDMRVLVGPEDPAMFDNPGKVLVFPGVEAQQYERIFDFGCGCGRNARKLALQDPRPVEYLGIDLHRGMIEWCQANLAPALPGFRFAHHDVFELGFNPTAERQYTLPFPCADDWATLAIAHSVFTHLNQTQTEHYLREITRVLRRDGVAYTTWFLFDKREFPMMQEEQNALFINEVNYTNAVIFDRAWLQQAFRDAGLVLYRAEPPTIRGFQWNLFLARADSGRQPVEIGEDTGPYGIKRASYAPVEAHRIGLQTAADDGP